MTPANIKAEIVYNAFDDAKSTLIYRKLGYIHSALALEAFIRRQADHLIELLEKEQHHAK